MQQAGAPSSSKARVSLGAQLKGRMLDTRPAAVGSVFFTAGGYSEGSLLPAQDAHE